MHCIARPQLWTLIAHFIKKKKVSFISYFLFLYFVVVVLYCLMLVGVALGLFVSP